MQIGLNPSLTFSATRPDFRHQIDSLGKKTTRAGLQWTYADTNAQTTVSGSRVSIGRDKTKNASRYTLTLAGKSMAVPSDLHPKLKALFSAIGAQDQIRLINDEARIKREPFLQQITQASAMFA